MAHLATVGAEFIRNPADQGQQAQSTMGITALNTEWFIRQGPTGLSGEISN